jgi:hypothetical protein
MIDPIGRLRNLAASGELRFVYIIGVARSNSTIVCRMLGEQLDGAVYEPATPCSASPPRHFAEVILKAYRRARRKVPAGQPVALAIKDLSLFVDDDILAFVTSYAKHIVFTVREPRAQHASLSRQLYQEFAPMQRVDAVVRHPFEAFWMAWYFLVLGRRYVATAVEQFGRSAGRLHRLAIAGWNLTSWRNIAHQFQANHKTPVTVFDATQMRRDPNAAMLAMGAIAANTKTANGSALIEVAGHSRMLRRSKWAAEALSSAAIKPLATPEREPNLDPFDRLVATTVASSYRLLRDCSANPLASEVVR